MSWSAATPTSPGEVVIGIETDRGLFVAALVAAGYQVFAVNPMSTSRYRDRHSTSGAKSDPGDAKVLADMVRTDRHNHRPVGGRQRDGRGGQGPGPGPSVDDLVAETPDQPAALDAARVLPGRPGRLRRPDQRRRPRGAPDRPHPRAGPDPVALARSPPPCAAAAANAASTNAPPRSRPRCAPSSSPRPPPISTAMGASVAASVAVIATMVAQIAALAGELEAGFEQHPDAEVVRSLPGLGTILGARVLGEFGDEPNRYATAKSRKNYAGTSPITRASGTKRVVLARYARNHRLADAIYLWAFAALTASPGARAFYDTHRAAGDTHHQALRALGNRLVGILHGCLDHHSAYDETIAWGHRADENPPSRLTDRAVGCLGR